MFLVNINKNIDINLFLFYNNCIALRRIIFENNLYRLLIIAGGGYEYGSFENLVNFQQDGIGAPQDLKNAMLANKNNVPLGVFFQANIPGYGVSVVCFYVENN